MSQGSDAVKWIDYPYYHLFHADELQLERNNQRQMYFQ